LNQCKLYGPGAIDLMPQAARGDLWTLKLGPEAQAETVCTWIGSVQGAVATWSV